MEQTTLLSTRLFTVEQRVYADKNGSTIRRDVVVHPGAVVILPILDAGRLVLIKNFRVAADEELWELPAGTREPGETAEETARRELEEETGYRPGSMEKLAEFYTSPGVMTERMHAFVARDLTDVGQRLESGEEIVAEILDVETVRRMFLDGTIKDGKTLATLGLFFARDGVRGSD